MPSERAKLRLDQFKSKLLDLSLRNKLLNYRPGRASSVPIVGEVPRVVTERLLEEDDRFGFLPKEGDGELVTDTTDRMLQTSLPPKDLSKVLYNLFLKSRTSFEEQGVVSLFLAIGLLEWFESEDSPDSHFAPVLMLPVTLERAGVGRPFKLSAAPEEVEVNPSLLRKLDVEFGLKPDMPDPAAGIDPDAILNALSAVLPEPRWRVQTDMHLGLFSFGKYIMYRDLEDQADVLLGNRLIARLVGEETDEAPPSPPDPKELDRLRHPRDVHQILDADSSQQVAIETTLRGSDLVLEGPPGTGKSQTIANLIAEFMAEGRTVLFVSEKMAALEVVKRRLDRAGLGDYVLELHSRHANKRAVVAELKRCLERERAGAFEDEGETDLLVRTRDRLDGYVRALHEPFAGQAAWAAFGALARNANARDVLGGIEKPEEVSPEVLGDRLRRIEDLARARENVTPRSSHPFRVARLTSLPRAVEIALTDAIRDVRKSADALAARVAEESDSLGLPRPESFTEIDGLLALLAHLAGSPRPDSMWVTDPRWRGATGDGRALAAKGRKYRDGRKALLDAWSEDVFDLPLPEIVDRRKLQAGKWTRWLTPSFWQDRKTLKTVRRPGARRSSKETIADLDLAMTVRDLGASIDTAGGWATEQLGRFFAGRETDWEKLDALCDFVLRTRELAGTADVPAGVGDAAAKPEGISDRAATLRGLIEKAKKEVRAFCRLVEAESGPANNGPEGLVTWAEGAIERHEEIHEWVAYRRTREACHEVGLAEWLGAAEAENLAGRELAPCYEKAFMTTWLDRVREARPELRDFDRTEHEAAIERFRELDRRHLTRASESIRSTLDEELPSSMSFSPDSDVGLLLREAAKKRRHLPIRQLLSRAGVAIRRLKPCFMMSPISVAQFLPPDSEPFDLIVFDEASQICPEDAIGALARGARLAVVGDSRQLPPTSFFAYDPDVDPEEDDDIEPLPDLESVLDLCVAQGFPRLRLLWHYRSRDESLIAFSNHHFYDSSLLTFPNPGGESGLGVELVHVADGVYDRGKTRTNHREAAAVARGIAHHALAHPNLSIGVVTFGEPQRRAVLEELEELMRFEPALEPLLDSREEDEPFFVKNLENVQGDERDVMFFSVGYGPDAEGRLHMNFGPLNGDGGHRRLNVAVTRARLSVKVFSSIRPEEIDLDRAKSRGARLLRSYLEYARDGGAGTSDTSEAERGALARAVATTLTEQGYDVAPRIGSSAYRIDLAVNAPEEGDGYLMGIESDGPTYRDAPTVRDRDRTRAEVLKGLGWRLARVWSADFARAPAREVDRLLDALIRPVEGAAREPDRPKSLGKTRRKSPGGLPEAEPYRITPMSRRKTRKAFDADSSELTRIVTAIVDYEGPVHPDDVARRVADTYDIRLIRKVRDAVEEAIEAVGGEGKIEPRGGFLWPPGRTGAQVRGPAAGHAARPIERVPDEEIESGLRMVLEVDLRLPEDALLKAVAKILGHRRPRPETIERVETVLARLVVEGVVEREEDQVSLVEAEDESNSSSDI